MFPFRAPKPRWAVLARTSGNLLDLDLVLTRSFFLKSAYRDVDGNGYRKCVKYQQIGIEIYAECCRQENWNNVYSFDFRDQFID
jgi:hypothetical protein